MQKKTRQNKKLKIKSVHFLSLMIVNEKKAFWRIAFAEPAKEGANEKIKAVKAAETNLCYGERYGGICGYRPERLLYDLRAEVHSSQRRVFLPSEGQKAAITEWEYNFSIH